MAHTTLISTPALAAQLADPALVIVDCRFDLANPAWGEQQYQAAHLPGARYAHLDRDLSGPKTGRNGRHPLPAWEVFQHRLGAWGITPETQVVAYDQDNGMYACRLWWMLRVLGHSAAAVLDGGWARWQAEGRPTSTAVAPPAAAIYPAQPQPERLLTVEAVAKAWLNAPARRLLDARAPERYRGEVEPLDRVAGHIPGAANRFYKDNLNADGTFRAPADLRAEFLALLGDTPPEAVGHYCGSGVSGAHNLLAMELAGLPGSQLYAGSWSEWSSDPERPVAVGPEPAADGGRM